MKDEHEVRYIKYTKLERFVRRWRFFILLILTVGAGVVFLVLAYLLRS